MDSTATTDSSEAWSRQMTNIWIDTSKANGSYASEIEEKIKGLIEHLLDEGYSKQEINNIVLKHLADLRARQIEHIDPNAIG